MKKGAYLLLLTFLLFGPLDIITAQTIRIKNETNIHFDSIIIDHERLDGRHTKEYTGGVFGVQTRYDSPPNQQKSIPYAVEITLGEGIYTLTFIGKDSTCSMYGVNAQKTKKLVLNRQNAAIQYNFPSRLCISDGVQLYYNFINSSDYTVYDIYPKFSNNRNSIGKVLFNTDQRLLPKESRKIFIIQEGLSAEDYMKLSIEFEIYAIDKEGNLKKGYIKENDLSVENIFISNKIWNHE